MKNEKGLTLVELLAVIVILGIVAAIAIPSIGSIIEKSKEDGIKADAITVINAAKTYVAANGVPAVASGATEPTLSKTDLAKYVSTVKLADDFTVTVNSDGTVYSITGSGTTGNVTITFTKATIDGINSDNGYGASRSIIK